MTRRRDGGSAAALVVLVGLVGLVGLMPQPASAEPEAAEGPRPGAPVSIAPGDTFTVDDMRFAVSDSKGIATVERDAGSGSGTPHPGRARVRLDATVLFAKDSARIIPAARSRMHEVADELAARGAGSLTITGYTDDLGTAAHGLNLSRRRATAVSDFLDGRLPKQWFPRTVTGRGEADPEVPNDSERHRRQNRRVIVEFRPR